MAGDSDRPEWLVVGQVSKPHGNKGEVLVWPLTDSPEAVFSAGRELLLGDVEGRPGDDPEPLVILGNRPYKRAWLVTFDTIEDRNEAEAIAGRYLLIRMEDAEPRAEGEHFYHELLGADVVTVDGQRVGRVREVYDTDPAHLLEVKGEGKVHLIPFTEQVVREVDAEAKRIVIDPPEGLLEL